MDIETRLCPRIHVDWPAVIETSQGSIEGKTKDISSAGVFILSSVEPELDQRISILIEAPQVQGPIIIPKEIIQCSKLERIHIEDLGISYNGPADAELDQFLQSICSSFTR